MSLGKCFLELCARDISTRVLKGRALSLCLLPETIQVIRRTGKCVFTAFNTEILLSCRQKHKSLRNLSLHLLVFWKVVLSRFAGFQSIEVIRRIRKCICTVFNTEILLSCRQKDKDWIRIPYQFSYKRFERPCCLDSRFPESIDVIKWIIKRVSNVYNTEILLNCRQKHRQP